MPASSANDPGPLWRSVFRPFQAHEEDTPVAFGPNIHDITRTYAGFLSGSGGYYHLSSPVNMSSHAESLA
jgi:hypothetical protein